LKAFTIQIQAMNSEEGMAVVCCVHLPIIFYVTKSLGGAP